MPERVHDDLPILDELGAELDRSMRAWRRVPWWRRVPPRLLGVVVAVAVPAGGASAAGTLLVLRGDVIPAPRVQAPEQTPEPQTARLAGVVAADPAPGRPRWTLRLATSQTGLLCSTVGQLQRGRFGIVGLDGRFRQLTPEAADACSLRRENAASLVGARVFDARRRRDVRTIVSGIAGDELRAAEVEAAGERRRLRVARGGVFVTALQGLPEDLGIRVSLRFADGHVERHPFGVAPMVLPDPGGGPAWRVEMNAAGNDDRTCVRLRHARERRNPVFGPSACGRLRRGARLPRGLYFAVRRVLPGTGGIPVSPFGEGRWQDTPPRLLVWGAAGEDVAAIDVRGPARARRTATWFRPNGAFAFLFGPDVHPRDVRVHVRMRDGRRLERTGSYGLVDPPELG